MNALVGQLYSGEPKHTEECAALPRTDAARLATMPKMEGIFPSCSVSTLLGWGEMIPPHTHFVKQDDFVHFTFVRTDNFLHQAADFIEDTAEGYYVPCIKIQVEEEDGDRP